MFDDLFNKYGKVVFTSNDKKPPTAEVDDDAESLSCKFIPPIFKSTIIANVLLTYSNCLSAPCISAMHVDAGLSCILNLRYLILYFYAPLLITINIMMLV